MLVNTWFATALLAMTVAPLAHGVNGVFILEGGLKTPPGLSE